jgi:hypothetical protein
MNAAAWRRIHRSLAIILLGIAFSGVAEEVRACACCLPSVVIRGRSQRPLAQFLAEKHVGLALELMEFTGTVGFEDRETSSESFDVTMSYADSVFTVKRSGGEVVLAFVPDTELEVFVSNVVDLNDAYEEWVFTGTIVSKGELLEFLLPTATLVIQGHQNMCFDPSRMVRWALALETNDPEWSGAAHGDIQMDGESWRKRAYGK